VMLESFLEEGKQEPGPPETLTYGQSVTDACMDFETTAAVLDTLAVAVRSRRKSLSRTTQAPAPALRPTIVCRRASFPAPSGTRSCQRAVQPTAGSRARASSMRSWDRS